MPSSLIFAGLVVLWLLILVPAVARRQQEVARLSPAVLSGRVLERPMRHRIPEVDMTERRDDGGATTVGELARQRDDVPSPREGSEVGEADERPLDERDWWGPEAGRDGDPDAEVEDRGREDGDREGAGPDAGPDAELDSDLDSDLDSERDDDLDDGIDDELDRELDRDEIDRDLDREDDDDPRAPAAHRYRPGRGGFDPEAAAATAHAKYAFRQRLVLALLVLLLGAGACALLVSDVFWWVAGGIGLALAGYLTYLRRQVRIEEDIRARRTQRLSGPRRPAENDDAQYDDATRFDDDHVDHDDEDARDDDARHGERSTETAVEDDATDDEDWTADDGETGRIRGTGEPLGVLPARCRTVDGPGSTEHASSLPRITAVSTPPIPYGTSLVDVDDEDELDAAVGATDHRRAAGE